MTFGGGMTMVYGGLLALRVGLEVTALYPALVQLPLYLGRRVLGRQFGVGWLAAAECSRSRGQFRGVTGAVLKRDCSVTVWPPPPHAQRRLRQDVRNA